MTQTLAPMSDKARTELIGRLTRILIAQDNLANAIDKRTDAGLDITEAVRWFEGLEVTANQLRKQLKRPWENRGREQSDATAESNK